MRDETGQLLAQASDVSVKFGAGDSAVQVLDKVNVKLGKGEFLVLLGPSGCGKSTLLRLFSGHLKPTAGKITFNGKRCNMVFQEHGLYPWMSVLDNVAFGLRMRKVPKAERRARALAELKLVGLEKVADAYPAQLSGGMKQRANIARAFANDSDLVLMDEPYAALDVQTRRLMQEQLLELLARERKSVIFVTHSIEEALLLGDRILVMATRPGRIRREIVVPFGRPRDLHSLRLKPEFNELNESIWEMISAEVKEAFRTGA
ncbi:MAG TPA: ABC transporter ATP-binding protein [Xanthobacteraceae bacterium]|nr:ABC transporter ATP-binding protein [Xanthobacteraceae bacterium]